MASFKDLKKNFYELLDDKKLEDDLKQKELDLKKKDEDLQKLKA